MYEVAIKHALCLPTIHLIASSYKGARPFDLHDVELIQYPKLKRRQESFYWSHETAEAFRRKLQQRAVEQLKAPLSSMFAKGLRQASAATSGTAIIHTVLEQKPEELTLLVRGLRLDIEFIVHDYPPNGRMDGERGERHGELLYSKHTHLRIANDTLVALICGARLDAAQSHQCSSICERISTVTEQLAAIIQGLKTVHGTQNATRQSPPRPTRKTLVAALQKIINQSEKLAHEISTLHNPINP